MLAERGHMECFQEESLREWQFSSDDLLSVIVRKHKSLRVSTKETLSFSGLSQGISQLREAMYDFVLFYPTCTPTSTAPSLFEKE